MPDQVVPISILVPTTEVYQIEELDLQNEGLKEFLVLLTQNVNTLALAANAKATGAYAYMEVANSKYWPPVSVPVGNYNTSQSERPAFHLLLNVCPGFVANLPNNNTLTMPHGLPVDLNYQIVDMWGGATNPTAAVRPPEFIPLPYPSTVLADTIECWWDNTNIYIRTAADYTAYTTVWMVIEYIKQQQP